MASEVYVYPRAVRDIDDITAKALINSGDTGDLLTFTKNNATFLRTRTGQKARLAFVGNAVDPGGESIVTFHILVNGARLPPPYDSFQQALGLTYDPAGRLVSPVDLPQNALIQVTADSSGGGTAYNAFIRLRIEYEDLN